MGIHKHHPTTIVGGYEHSKKMAESVVTFFLEKLHLLITQESRLLGGVDEQVRLLHDELEFIKSFLREADTNRREDKRVNILVRQIRELAFDAEDAMDFFILKTEQQRQRNIGLRFICYPSRLITLHRLGNQIEVINRRIEKILENKSKYAKLLESVETSSHSNNGLTWKMPRDPIDEKIDVVGFENEAAKLKELLTQGEDQRRHVISIAGMGGSGKTTLAKNVYHDIKKDFESCAWINVSQEYSIIDILHKTIAQVVTLQQQGDEKKWTKNPGPELLGHLKEKKYLIVFDDVWEKTVWDELRNYLPDKNKQSRVLLTTRNKDVAKHADSSSEPIEPHLLNEEEGLNLLLRKALPEPENCPDELKKLGREMVVKCGRLPLAIVALGGLLSTKEMNEEEWKRVNDSVKWQLNEGPDNCREVLYSSYIDLPYYLKSCFLYLGLFPEDSQIDCERLIRLWVAEGFIQQRGEETMEDVAQDYLKELTQRSMIQVVGRRYDGGFSKCRIHDLMRDLAISEAQQYKFLNIYGNDSSKSLNRTRRLSIHANSGNYDNTTGTLHHTTVNHLHSLFCFTRRVKKTLQKTFYGSFKLLRVLDLEGATDVEKLPKEIGQLIHLKYFSLANTNIQSLPRSIGNLYNLQTINISDTLIQRTPRVIWKLRQLRHISFSCNGWLSRKQRLLKCISKIVASNKCFNCGRPPRIDRPTDLRTLSLPTGSWIAGGLHKLTYLRELRIHGDLRSYKKNLFRSIVKLDRLQVLYLNGELESLPDPSEFPPNLTELYLVDSYIKPEENPMVTLENLPNLKVLLLNYTWTRVKMICSAQGFPKLEELRVVSLIHIEDLIVEPGAMPKLKYLRILRTWLNKFPDGLEHLTSLENIWIDETNKLRVREDGSEGWDKFKNIITFKKFTW